MLERSRLKNKKISKTEAVQSQLASTPLAEDNIHIGPSDYVPWQGDNKVCFLRLEAVNFCGVPFELEARLSVQDSPNSAGVVIDAVRYCRVARDRGASRGVTAGSRLFYEASSPPDGGRGGPAPTGRIPGQGLLCCSGKVNWADWYLQWVETCPTALLHRTAFQPNHLTFSALFFSVLVIPSFLHSFWLGGLTVLIAGALDTLDGSLARRAGQTSPLPGPSSIPCWIATAIFLFTWASGRLWCCGRLSVFVWITLLIFFCVQGSALVSYARARGEGLGVSTSTGLFGRAERLVTLGLGSIVNDLLRRFWPRNPWLEAPGIPLGGCSCCWPWGFIFPPCNGLFISPDS